MIGDDPRCEFIDAVDRMLGDAREHEAQIRLWIDAVEFCGANEAVDRGGTFAAGVCSSEQIVASIMLRSA
ncbi:hypothetical protein QFZ94_002944 [Paraburkholderia sp. JPY465]